LQTIPPPPAHHHSPSSQICINCYTIQCIMIDIGLCNWMLSKLETNILQLNMTHTNAYEDIWIYCIVDVVNHLHVRLGHPLWPSWGRSYTKDILQRHKKPLPPVHTYFFNFRMVIKYTIVHGTFITDLNLAQIILYVLYILIYVLSHTFYICALVFGVFVIYTVFPGP